MSSSSHPDRPRGVALLGSGGSIGRQSLDVLAGLAPDWRVVALATGTQAALLEAQAREHRPSAVALASARPLDLPAGTIRVSGPDALVELATRDDVDLVVVATGGVVSLRPVLAALRAGKVVATANKETLVAGGHLVMREALA
ncbi:MAG TPA: 1-deoxy-D-xylulose-5-phosphate reductoisomerase, partial [Verrucomicrobiae bacterium]|nr:1-deoxy-D-xylulose-5-phosphate reductoisomerase [Verrucomicrobiae bacterium]